MRCPVHLKSGGKRSGIPSLIRTGDCTSCKTASLRGSRPSRHRRRGPGLPCTPDATRSMRSRFIERPKAAPDLRPRRPVRCAFPKESWQASIGRAAPSVRCRQCLYSVHHGRNPRRFARSWMTIELVRAHWRTARSWSSSSDSRCSFGSISSTALRSNSARELRQHHPTYSAGRTRTIGTAPLLSFQSGRTSAWTDAQLPLGNQNPRRLFPVVLPPRRTADRAALQHAWQGVLFTFLLSAGPLRLPHVFPTYALGKEAFGRKAGISEPSCWP